MPLPLLFALVVAQGQSTSPATRTVVQPITQSQTKPAAPPPEQPAKLVAAPAEQPFQSPFVVTEPNRLALTPKIDGKLDDEEWDPITRSADSQMFFNWEPGKLYIAGIVPVGHDLLASFDLHANGWLHGKDNLEVRVGNVQGKVSIVARVMDATDIAGPKWLDLPGFAMSCKAATSTDGKTVVYEASIGDIGLGLIPTEKGAKILMRMDAPASTETSAPAYLPRALTPVTLVMTRFGTLPKGLSFNPEGVGRSSIAGEIARLRMAFDGNNGLKLQKLEMHTEGPAKNDMIQLTAPFPKFDDKGRSYVDYISGLMEGSPEGYRILRGTLSTADNVNTVLECNYRVGPPVDFDLVRQNLPIAALDRSLKFGFYERSNSTKKVTGDVTIVAPEPLRILNGAQRNVSITTVRGQIREEFDLFFPPNISGTFPIKFVATVNGHRYEQIRFITVGGG